LSHEAAIALGVWGFIALLLGVLIFGLVFERMELRRVRRLQGRADLSGPTFVELFYPQLVERSQDVEIVLREIASWLRLSIPPGKLRPTDRFDDLCRLSRDFIQGISDDEEMHFKFLSVIKNHVDGHILAHGLPASETVDQLLRSLFVSGEQAT
jgi:hypothetical protein